MCLHIDLFITKSNSYKSDPTLFNHPLLILCLISAALMTYFDVLAHTCVVISDLWAKFTVQNEKYNGSNDEH